MNRRFIDLSQFFIFSLSVLSMSFYTASKIFNNNQFRRYRDMTFWANILVLSWGWMRFKRLRLTYKLKERTFIDFGKWMIVDLVCFFTGNVCILVDDVDFLGVLSFKGFLRNYTYGYFLSLFFWTLLIINSNSLILIANFAIFFIFVFYSLSKFLNQVVSILTYRWLSSCWLDNCWFYCFCLEWLFVTSVNHLNFKNMIWIFYLRLT